MFIILAYLTSNYISGPAWISTYCYSDMHYVSLWGSAYNLLMILNGPCLLSLILCTYLTVNEAPSTIKGSIMLEIIMVSTIVFPDSAYHDWSKSVRDPWNQWKGSIPCSWKFAVVKRIITAVLKNWREKTEMAIQEDFSVWVCSPILDMKSVMPN